MLDYKKRSFVNNQDPFGPNNFLGKVARVNKFQDYFTSCLPAPQKGEPVQINLGDRAPLASHEEFDIHTHDFEKYVSASETHTTMNTLFGDSNDFVKDKSSLQSRETKIRIKQHEGSKIVYDYADLSKAESISINDLRQAFALQKMLERDARSGTRYIEMIQSHFGIESDDARLQRPEFLGGKNDPIQISQVLQTAPGSDNNSAVANVAGFSHSQSQLGVSKSFTEHGFVMGLTMIRQKHSYQQGINKMFLRNVRTDYYDPVFAGLGEQPVLQAEIYAFGDKPLDHVFGYNEAFSDYRYKPDMITGQMRSDTKNGFDI